MNKRQAFDILKNISLFDSTDLRDDDILAAIGMMPVEVQSELRSSIIRLYNKVILENA